MNPYPAPHITLTDEGEKRLDWLCLSRSSCGGEPAPTSGVGPGVTNAPSRTRPTDGPLDHRLRRTRGRHHRRASERRRAIIENHVPTDANEAFAQLGRIVFGEQPLDRILEQVVHIAKKVIPTPVEVPITLIADDKPFTVAFTDPSAVELDERQYETERGPCLDAAASGQLISIPYTSAETRWPRFTQTAAENGVASTLSVPLPVQRQVTGALNFYASEPAAFSEEIVELTQTFAAHAAVAAANAHLYE